MSLNLSSAAVVIGDLRVKRPWWIHEMHYEKAMYFLNPRFLRLPHLLKRFRQLDLPCRLTTVVYKSGRVFSRGHAMVLLDPSS